MFFIPFFMRPFKISAGIVLKEQKQEIEDRRTMILNIVKSCENGQTMREIADKANYDICKISAILTALARQGKIESVVQGTRKLWKERK